MADIRFMFNNGDDEQGVYGSLEEAVKAAARAVPEDRGVVFWSPAHRPEDHSPVRGVVAVRIPGEGVYEFEDRHGIDAWWSNLPAGVREALATEPGKVLTADEIVSVTNTRPVGQGAVSVAWVESGDPEQGRYRLFQGAQRFVRAMSS